MDRKNTYRLHMVAFLLIALGVPLAVLLYYWLLGYR